MNTVQENEKHKGKSPHYSGGRDGEISAIVIHDTASRNAPSTINWFLHPNSRVSSHIIIDRDGTIYRMVEDKYKAWHAGKSSLHGVDVDDSINAISLGVELVDTDEAPRGTNDLFIYTEAQLDSLIEWCAQKCNEYAIPLNRIVGHDMVCVPHGRKVDPGKDFPWMQFLIDVADAQRVLLQREDITI